MNLRGEQSPAHHLDTVFQILLLSLLAFSPVIVWRVTGLPNAPVKQAFGELLIVCMASVWLLRMNETGAWKVHVSGLSGAVVLFIGIETVSAIAATNRGYAFRSVRQFVFPAILYLVTLNNIEGHRQIRNSLVAMTVAGFLVSGYGLLQCAGLDFMGWGDDQTQRLLAACSFGTPKTAANFLVTVFPIAVALVLYARSVAGKLGAGAAALLTLLHLRVTMCTEAIVALELAVPVALLGVCVGWSGRDRFRDPRFRRRAVVGMVGWALLLAVTLGATHGSALLRARSDRFRVVRTQDDAKRALRNSSWLCATRMAAARPVLGSGPGSYQIESAPFWNDFQKRWFARFPEARQVVDNEYLVAAAETGILGAGSLILVISVAGMYCIYACRRTMNDRMLYLAVGAGSSLVAAAINGFTSATFHQPTVMFRVFFLLGAIQLLSVPQTPCALRATHKICGRRGIMYYAVWVVAIVVFLVMVWVVARPLAYYQHLESGRGSYRVLDMPDKAKEELHAATRIYPSDWEPYVLRARIAADGSALGAAAWEYGAATRFNPNHLVVLVNSGKALLESGLKEAAVAPLERAVRLSPYLAAARYSLGEAYAAVGNWTGALENFGAAESTGFADRAVLYLNQGISYYHLGDYSRSDERLRAALEMEPTNGHLWYEIGQLQLDSKNARGALLALGNVVILAEREPIERNELIGAYCQLVNLNLDVAKDIRMASHCAVQAAELGGDDAQVKEAVKRLLDVVQSDAVRRENTQVLPMVLYNLAVAIVRSQIPGDAVSFLDQAVSLAEKEQPAVARDARVRLAELKLGYGHYNAALADLDAAERIDAMDPNVFRVRGDVYEAMERRGEAREAYAHALGIRPSDSQSREALRRLVGLA